MENIWLSYEDRNKAPKRYQSVYWKVIEITDLSWFVNESVSATSPDIDVISSSKLFKQDEVVLWIGKPNVFLLIPDDKGNHLRYAAKSCWRAESKLERTRWIIQSWVFFIIKNLSNDQIQKLRTSAKNREWEKNITCVNANARVLNDWWIKLWNWENLDDIILPVSIFRAIDKYWLKINDIILETETIKTTNLYLENQMFLVNKAVIFTFFRHAKRFLSKFKSTNSDKNKETEKSNNINFDENVISLKNDNVSDLNLKISNPSKIAVPLRLIWGAHTIFKLEQNRVDIDKFLPNKLAAYPQEKPSLFTIIKKKILFNKVVVWTINLFLQNWSSEFTGKSQTDLYNMFELNTDKNPCKYNIVASKTWVMLMKINIKNNLVDWVLSKHVLVSNYDESVRFAWEAWKDENWTIWISNDSGTYRPTKDDLDKFILYLKEIFPDVSIKAFNK